MDDRNLDLAVVETLNQFDLKPLRAIPISCKTTKPHVKRPMNAFMVWSRSARKTISQNTQPLPSNQLSKTLGEMWNRLTYEQKLPFIEEANRLKSEHLKQNPGYKYQPKRKPKKCINRSEKQEGIKSKNYNLDTPRLANVNPEPSNVFNSTQLSSSQNNHAYYQNYFSSAYPLNPMHYSQSVNDNYFTSIFNHDYTYSNSINHHGFNYEANSYNYPYSPYSVNSSYSIDSNASN